MPSTPQQPTLSEDEEVAALRALLNSGPRTNRARPPALSPNKSPARPGAAASGDQAARLLERPYRFEGLVVAGRGLGRRLGWPTANLEVDGRKFLPGEGVYAVRVWCAGEPDRPLAGVMNLGPQPTIDPGSPSAVEVHLLEAAGLPELRGSRLLVEPVGYLRGQRRFAGLEELSAAIAADAVAASRALAACPQPAP